MNNSKGVSISHITYTYLIPAFFAVIVIIFIRVFPFWKY